MTTNLAEHDTVVPVDAAAAPETYPYILLDVDPRKLRAEGNSREVGDIRQSRPELVASVAEHGVHPKASLISVAPGPDGVLDVLVGFHRTAAAVAVAERENPGLTIPVLVHEPGTSRRDLLVVQGIENLHRQGYTPDQEAGLYRQMELEGLDDEQIARALSRPAERVRAGRAVAAAPRTRAASEAMPELDLLELSQLTEFADDEEDHRTLVDFLAHNPRNFEHKVEQIRKKRRRRALQSEEAARLAEQGYALVEDEHHPPEGTVRLDELCDGDDPTPLDPAEHADCPGRAVAVDVNYQMEVETTGFCADPAAHGHRTIVAVKTAAAETALRGCGIAVLADPLQPATARAVENLFGDEQAERTLTAEEHAGCPGHAAYVEADPYSLDVEVVYVCTDPHTHGHVSRESLSAQPERCAAFRAGENNRARENNKLWREAKGSRREWLAKFFTGWKRKKAADLPQRVHHWLALAPVLASDFLAEAAPSHRYARELLKLGEPAGRDREDNPLAAHLRKKATSETQAVLIRLAQVLGACEAHWDRAYTDKNADSSWRRPSEDTRFYFELLEALGYPLEHVEQLVNRPELDNDRWPHLAPETSSDDDQTRTGAGDTPAA